MKLAITKSKDSKKRAAYIVGHLQGVQKMIEEGRYCIDIIKQIDAIEGSLQKLRQTMLENHLHGCVADTMKNGNKKQRSEAIKEILEVYKSESK